MAFTKLTSDEIANIVKYTRAPRPVKDTITQGWEGVDDHEDRIAAMEGGGGGGMPVVVGATANNFPLFDTGGVLKDSGVTGVSLSQFPDIVTYVDVTNQAMAPRYTYCAISKTQGTHDAFTMPANGGFIKDIFVIVMTKEDTGTKTLDVGIDGGVTDTDGLAAGLDVGTAGSSRPGPVLDATSTWYTGNTRGVLMSTTKAGSSATIPGIYFEFPFSFSPNDKVTYTVPTGGYTELDAFLCCEYVENVQVGV